MSTEDWKAAEGTVTSVTTIYTRGRAQYTVGFHYSVAGQVYERSVFTFRAYSEGDSIALKYDPENPELNDLELRLRRQRWIGLSIAIVFFTMAAVLVLFMFWFNLFGSSK